MSSAGPLEVSPRLVTGRLVTAGSSAFCSAFGREHNFFCQNEEIRPALVSAALVHTQGLCFLKLDGVGLLDSQCLQKLLTFNKNALWACNCVG